MARESFPPSLLFQGLTSSQVEALAKWMETVELSEDAIIEPEGVMPQGLYLLDRGSVDGVQAGECVGRLDAPTAFGIVSFLTDQVIPVGFQAATAVRLRRLARSTFERQLSEDDPIALRLGYNIGRIACHRLIELGKQLPSVFQTAGNSQFPLDDSALHQRLQKLRDHVIELG